MCRNTSMIALHRIEQFRNYLDYLEEHILNVERAWKILQDCCPDMKFIWDDYSFHTLDAEIKYHDLSKFSAEEFIQYRLAFYSCDDEEKNTPLGAAWEHHKEHNPHHWENWTKTKNDTEQEKHCVHMVVDWLAMSLKFGDSPQTFYEKQKLTGKIDLPEWAEDFIFEIFDRFKKVNNG